MFSEALHQLFLRVEDSWPLFWGSLWITFGLWLASSLWPYDAVSPWRRWNRPWLYTALLLLTLVAFRWPAIGSIAEFNPDESQLLAGGLTLVERGGLWKLDMGTCGPGAFLPLAVPGWLGWPVDYATGRGVALLMAWGTLVFAWLGLRHLLSDHLARVLVLPMGCMIVCAKYDEFVQYSSEHAPLLYLAAAFWLLITAFDAQGSVLSRARLLGGGFLLGLLPFTKLQSVPLGAILGGCVLVWIMRQPGLAWRQRARDAGWLLGGVLLAAGLVLAGYAAQGLLGHFYHSYIAMNVIYTGERAYPWSEFGYWLWFMSGVAWGFGIYLWPSWVLVALALPFWPQVAQPLRRALVLGGLLFLGGYFVVGAPGRTSQHYLQFIVLPSTLFLAVFYGGLLSHPGWSRWRRALWYGPVLYLGVWLQIDHYYSDHWRPHYGELHDARANALGPVARYLQPHIRPGDTLSVWGWASFHYVQTQLPQATREAHTERQLASSKLRDYYRDRYFTDLQSSRPAFFLDAVGPEGFGFKYRELDGHETLPALRDFIATHYRLAADLESTRIYIRRDRLDGPPAPAPDPRDAR